MRVLLALACMTAGCASIENTTGGAPYFDVGLGYQLDASSSWYVGTGREWQCSDNMQGHFEFGLDWGATSLGYHHQSWWTCGGPFNDRSELYQDDIRLIHRFGGRQ